MGLALNLKDTATSLIDKLGNTLSLVKTTNDNIYDPQTGNYGSPSTINYTRKGYVAPVTTDELQASGLKSENWGTISKIITMVADDEIIDIDNTWSIDGLPVNKVTKTEAQDTTIVLNVYVG